MGIAHNTLSLLAIAALLSPDAAMAQAADTPFSHEEIVQCYKASALYFIFSNDEDFETQDKASEQASFWLDQMQPNMDAYRTELDAFSDETFAAVQSTDMDTVSAGYLTKWADTFNACTDKWGGQVARKIESPAPVTNFTLEESQACLLSTVAVLLVTERDGDADTTALNQSGQLWAIEADKHGPLSNDDDAACNTRADHMVEAWLAATTPEQTAAFLAPYEADFAACEAKIKTVAGG
jgi:hypothetical protein